MKNALVTGGAGFIGSHLVARLLGDGWAVTILDDFSSGSLDNLPGDQALQIIQGSVADEAVCQRACAGIDAVFHMAGIASVAASLVDPVSTHATNLTGTVNILKAARDAGVRRVVFSSSASVYGDCERIPIDECEPVDPQSPYASQKAGSELYCRNYRRLFGLQTVILRYFNVFGPRQSATSGYAAAIPIFVDAALHGKPATIFGDGRQTRDFVYVDDVARANILAATTPEADGHTFNIASGRGTTVLDLIDSIDRAAGTRTVRHHVAPRPGEVRHSLARAERACSILNFCPRVDLEEGLRRTFEAAAGTVEVTEREAPIGKPELVLV